MKLEERLYNGDRAREILENEVFQQVFSDYKTEITTQWMNSPVRAEADREKCWLALQMLGRIQQMLQTTLETGKLAQLDLEHKRSKEAMAKEWKQDQDQFSTGSRWRG